MLLIGWIERLRRSPGYSRVSIVLARNCTSRSRRLTVKGRQSPSLRASRASAVNEFRRSSPTATRGAEIYAGK